jgi:hypothetical protein
MEPAPKNRQVDRSRKLTGAVEPKHQFRTKIYEYLMNTR